MFRGEKATIPSGAREFSDFPQPSWYAKERYRTTQGDKKVSELWAEEKDAQHPGVVLEHVTNPRKLAAIQIATLGPTFAFGNFAGTAILCLSLGGYILWRSNSYPQLTFGFYFVSLAVNNMLMLLYALEINNRESARAEIGNELNRKRDAMAEYRRQSIYFLIPLVIPILALQRRYKSGPSQ